MLQPRKTPLLACAGLLIVGLAIFAAVSQAQGSESSPPALDLSQHLGKVVYVDFWASWCAPCKKSFPWMMALHDSLGSDGLVILTVNVDRERSRADDFIKSTGSTLPVLYDPQGKLAAAYELQAMPSSFVYGRDGTLRASHMGFHADKTDEIEAELRALLAEEPKHETQD